MNSVLKTGGTSIGNKGGVNVAARLKRPVPRTIGGPAHSVVGGEVNDDRTAIRRNHV